MHISNYRLYPPQLAAGEFVMHDLIDAPHHIVRKHSYSHVSTNSLRDMQGQLSKPLCDDWQIFRFTDNINTRRVNMARMLHGILPVTLCKPITTITQEPIHATCDHVYTSMICTSQTNTGRLYTAAHHRATDLPALRAV